jgi:hypothetical protein
MTAASNGITTTVKVDNQIPCVMQRNFFYFSFAADVQALTHLTCAALTFASIPISAFIHRSAELPWSSPKRQLDEERGSLWILHQVSDWSGGAAPYFCWMPEAKRENARWSLTDERQSSRSKGAQPGGLR